ncbi:MAG: 50S ribosomal protein L18 [Candidatus Marsarchaeota archaeon]|jgi:large subunit ribosomal protein L18|nr:50S ribosomal protein L18 [Candidatus Marsarchaeota archaeon]
MKIIKRRRAKSLTNYRKRIAMLKGRLPRVVIRRSNRSITAQIIDYKPDGDVVMASAVSTELKNMGWLPKSNIPTAYLTGMLLAKKASEKGIKGSMILDIGLHKPIKGNVIFSAAKGCKDNGIDLVSEIEADDDRISGKHIAEYAKMGSKKGTSEFSLYEKSKLNVKELDKLFEGVKGKITITK